MAPKTNKNETLELEGHISILWTSYPSMGLRYGSHDVIFIPNDGGLPHNILPVHMMCKQVSHLDMRVAWSEAWRMGRPRMQGPRNAVLVVIDANFRSSAWIVGRRRQSQTRGKIDRTNAKTEGPLISRSLKLPSWEPATVDRGEFPPTASKRLPTSFARDTEITEALTVVLLWDECSPEPLGAVSTGSIRGHNWTAYRPGTQFG